MTWGPWPKRIPRTPALFRLRAAMWFFWALDRAGDPSRQFTPRPMQQLLLELGE